MFGLNKKTEAEREVTLVSYRARFNTARGLADADERNLVLKKLDREIEREAVKPRRTRLGVLARKYGFVIGMPPAVAVTTALLVSLIGYPAFLFSMTLAWIGGVRALNQAERPREKIPYRIYEAKKEAEAAPFRALQAEIKAQFNAQSAKDDRTVPPQTPSASPKPF